MNDFIQALEKVTKNVQKFFERILSGVLEILEAIYQWFASVIRIIGSYLDRLFTTLGKLIGVLAKLALFYVPGVVAIFIGIFGDAICLFFVGLGWLILITIIGLTDKGQ